MSTRARRAAAALLALATVATLGPAAAARPAPQAVSDYVVFSLNTQDFSYPLESAATLGRILDVHERYAVPLDVYLSTTMTDLYAAQAPALLARLTSSPVVAVSYHSRPPTPYYTGYDWSGLAGKPADEQRAIVERYETHGLDLATGQTTAAPGGYGHLASLLGYAPYVAAFQTDAAEGAAVASVFKTLGARLFIQHGRVINLGERRDGVYLRPEHVDLRLFQHVGEAPAAVIDTAVAEAHAATGGRAPYFVGVKMHDNDFFAEDSAWVTVYVKGPRRPPWDITRKSPLLSAADRDAVWALYEGTVAYVAGQAGRLTALNAPGLWSLLGGQPEPTAGPAPLTPTLSATTSPTSAPATATPAPTSSPNPSAGPPLLYVSGTMHIETNRQSWPDPDALLAFFRRVTAAGHVGTQATGMRWSVGADIGWLNGEPRAAEVMRALTALGVEMDVHAHMLSDRANCFAALTGFGARPNQVASGVLVSELDALRQPIRANGTTWQAEVVWGTVYRAGHGPGADDNSFGVWRPASGGALLVHDPAGTLVNVGGGTRELAAAETLARRIAAGGTWPPVTSASVMFDPRDLRVSADVAGVAALEASAARLGGLTSVRWATIAETAAAWLAAGGMPSRMDDARSPAPAVPPTATVPSPRPSATASPSALFATSTATVAPASPTSDLSRSTASYVRRQLHLPLVWARR